MRSWLLTFISGGAGLAMRTGDGAQKAVLQRRLHALVQAANERAAGGISVARLGISAARIVGLMKCALPTSCAQRTKD